MIILLCGIPLQLLAADPLPPGVPNPITTDGKYTDAIRFTTSAYRDAAFMLLLQEANTAARELGLPEKLPISRADVVDSFIAPFGYSYASHCIGNIGTRNYAYGVTVGNKLSTVHRMDLDATCFDYRDKFQTPTRLIDTNGAHRLATQFLAAIRVDAAALDRDLRLQVEPSRFWNDVGRTGQITNNTFVPIYDVWWEKPSEVKRPASAAYVQLFTPTKALLQLVVRSPEYILREPVVFTNLAELLTGTNAPPAHTNSPSAPQGGP